MRGEDRGDALPVVGHEEDFLFGTDDDVSIVLHDIGDERDDREGYGRGRTEHVGRTETGKRVTRHGGHEGEVHLRHQLGC